jgi:hypothetical protein
LEHTTSAVSGTLHELKLEVDSEARKARMTQIVVGSLALLGAALGTFEYFRRRPSATLQSESIETTSNS